MLTNFQYTFKGSAPGHPFAMHVFIDEDTQAEAEHKAREEIADFLGVRAEHVVLRLVSTQARF